MPPGIYQGNLVLDKPLVLEGVGRPVIRGDGKGSVITATADRCTIRGFRIERSGPMLVEEDSGILLKSSGNQVIDNVLEDVLFGIYLLRSNRNTIRGNLIRGRAYLEVGERGSGLHIYDSVDNTIAGNTISQVRDGMYLQNAHRSLIRANRASDLRYGLHYMFSNENTFEDNTFERSMAGAAIMYSRRIDFRRNAFLDHRGFSSYGILFQDSDDCTAEHNVIAGNVVGIFLEALRTSVFRGNLIAANDTAIEVFSSAADNQFSGNNFIENLSPITLVGKRTTTRWDGNYWSEYAGYDLDGDGVGDVPFRIQNLFEHLEGNFPRLRVFFFSPASQALTLAEKAFPVIEGSREFDRYPLMKPVPLPVNLPAPERTGSRLAFTLPAFMVALSGAVVWRGRRR